jgi:hypothetical protein
MAIAVLVSFPSPLWVTSKHADHGQPHIEHFLVTYRAEIRYMKKTGSLDFGSGFACPCSPPCPSVAGEHTHNDWSMSYRVLPVHVQGRNLVMVSRHKWLHKPFWASMGRQAVSKLSMVHINLEQFLGIYRATI